MKTSKTIAVVAVMFMLCAGIAVVINGSEVSDAANKTIDYQFNLRHFCPPEDSLSEAGSIPR